MKTKKKLTFKYLTPDSLQDCHVNGVWGGATPRGEIHAHFFSERHPIPKEESFEITDSGKLDPASAEMKKDADVIRLVQASVVMDVSTAIAARDWLDSQVKAILSNTNKQTRTEGNE